MNCRLGLLITVLDEPKNEEFLLVSEVCSFSLEQLPPQQAWSQASLASRGGRAWEQGWKWASAEQEALKILSLGSAEPCPACSALAQPGSAPAPSLSVFGNVLDASGCTTHPLGASQSLPSMGGIRDSAPPACFISKSL